MIYKVPVVRYLGFDQSGRQPQSFGCPSSQTSDHGVLWGLIIRISAFRKTHDRLMTLLRTASEQDRFRSGGDIVNYFWGKILLRRGQNAQANPAAPVLQITACRRTSLDFALKRQHRNVIFLLSSADVGKKLGANPLHEFKYVCCGFR